MGRIAVHTHRPWWVTPWSCEDGDREVTRKVCGVLVAMLQGQSWPPTPTTGTRWTWEALRLCPLDRPSGPTVGRFVNDRRGRGVAEPS